MQKIVVTFQALKMISKRSKHSLVFISGFYPKKLMCFDIETIVYIKSIQNYNYNKNKCYLKHSLMAYSNTDWVGRLTRKIADSMSWHMDRQALDTKLLDILETSWMLTKVDRFFSKKVTFQEYIELCLMTYLSSFFAIGAALLNSVPISY